MIDENKMPMLTYKQKIKIRDMIINRCFRNAYITFFIFLCVVEYYCNNEISVFANLLISLIPSMFITDILYKSIYKKVFESEKELNKLIKKGWIKEDK